MRERNSIKKKHESNLASFVVTYLPIILPTTNNFLVIKGKAECVTIIVFST